MFTAYLLAFIICLSVSLVATWYVRKVACAHGWVDVPDLDRHVHTIALPRLGGVAIYVSFTAVIVTTLLVPGWIGLASRLPARMTLSLLGPALIIFLLGLYDDLRPVGPYWKFGVQIVAAVMLYANGFGIHDLRIAATDHSVRSIVGLPLTVLWVLLITNAFNLIDGLDGLAAGSALFSTLVVFVISLVMPNPFVTFLTVALAGAILGFLRFNSHPASIFLGDCGSLFIGFMLSTLALAGSQKAPTMVAVAIPVVSLGLPILDVALAVMRRFLGGKPLFTADAGHIHHQLLKRGFSQRSAVLILYAVTAGFGFLGLVILQERRVIALVLAVAGIGVFVGLQQLHYLEMAELLSAMKRVVRRRQILANHVAIRHAAESLNQCNEFCSICQALKQALQPIGFDGIRLQMSNPNGFAPSSFQPLRHGPEGHLLFSWSEHEIGEPPWELRLELVTSAQKKWGYLCLIRMSDSEALPLDVNILAETFRTSLSNAVDRACTRLEASKQDGVEVDEPRVHKVLAGSIRFEH